MQQHYPLMRRFDSYEGRGLKLDDVLFTGLDRLVN
jgi:hypothetical protein